VRVESLEAEPRIREMAESAVHVAAIEAVHAESDHRSCGDERIALHRTLEPRDRVEPAPRGEGGRDRRPTLLVHADRRGERFVGLGERADRREERRATDLHFCIERDVLEGRERRGGRVGAERVGLEQSREPASIRIEDRLRRERHEPVPAAALGQEVLGSLRVALDLLAQRVHGDLDRAAAHAGSVPPDLLEQTVLAHDLVGVTCEPREELRLDARNRGHAFALPHLSHAQVGETSV
jgi:hypothetical protein